MVIGITGSFGAGKGAAVEYLKEKREFHHFSASGFITEEIVRRDFLVDRESMIYVANDLRKEFGPTYIIDQLYLRAGETGGDAVIESLRALAEVRRIKELGGFVLGIDADAHIRYERAFARGSEKDNVPFDIWIDQEKRESNLDDPTKQNIFGSLAESDTVIQNNASLEELHAEVDRVLASIQEQT